ncbi:hypothetical protein K7432_011755, partial [Basidiobolus ranarum]
MSHLPEYSSFPVKKSKASRACDVCRKRKVKCDGATPACSHCADFGLDCIFTYKPKKRGPNPSKVTLLESRLEKLELLVLPLVGNHCSRAREETQLLPESVNISHEEDEKEDNALSKISQNLGKLAIGGKKSFRYVGSSSGLYVLEGGKYNRYGLIQELKYHLQNDESIPLALSQYLPLQELTTRLLSIYFDRFHRYVPIFNKVDFQDRISSGKEVSLTLLYSIYALVCSYIQIGDIFEDAETLYSVSNYFFTQAKAYLDKEYLTPSVQTVQALILLSFQPEGDWMFLGMAIRIGQELGLHRNLDLDKMDLVQKQNRQLTWWGCFFLDRLLSSILGRPMCINEKDCDVKLPVDICSIGSNKTTIEDEF